MSTSSASRHGAFVDLPSAYTWLVPEIEALEWPEEQRADCAHCVMLPEPLGETPAASAFDPEVRCCTYQPEVANFLLGRALQAGGPSAELVWARLVDGVGLRAVGLDPPSDWRLQYRLGSPTHFGRDRSIRCPFWVGGQLTCGIWPHRNGVCRTWFCRHTQGVRGGALWEALRDALTWVDGRLARWCVSRGTPPDTGAAAGVWSDWYRWCAERVDSAEREEVLALVDDDLRQAREGIRWCHAELEAPRPRVVVPGVERMEPIEDGVRLWGIETYDPVDAPSSVFSLLAALDGRRTWAEALAHSRREGEECVDDDTIGRLIEVGALRPLGDD